MCVNFYNFLLLSQTHIHLHSCVHAHAPTCFTCTIAGQKVRTSPVEEPDLSAITVPTTLFDSSIMPKGYQAPLPLQVVKANIKTSYKLGNHDKVDAVDTNVKKRTHTYIHTRAHTTDFAPLLF
jgi:hypothetical protein